MASVIHVYKMQLPQHSNDPNPTILVYEVDEYGERLRTAANDMNLPVTKITKRLFKRGPGQYWARIFVKGTITSNKELVVHSFTMKGQWY